VSLSLVTRLGDKVGVDDIDYTFDCLEISEPFARYSPEEMVMTSLGTPAELCLEISEPFARYSPKIATLLMSLVAEPSRNQ